MNSSRWCCSTRYSDPFNTDPECAEDVFRGPDQQFASESVWEAVRNSRLFGLVGESGSGKTTLIDDFKDRVRRETLPVRLIQPMFTDKKNMTARAVMEAIIADIAPGVTMCASSEKLTRQAAENLSETIGTFKAKAFADVAAFVDLSAEQYGVALGGRKGNVTLMSFDGSLKVVRAISESITFDERLQAAKALIDECFLDWTSTARPEVKALIDRAFEVDREGNIRTGAVLSLRRVDIQDERWVRAMQAINDAVQVVGSKAYIRVYKRIGDTEKWEPLALDVAGV